MLDPNDRTLLRNSLRPPPGYVVDRAILTTFSLDLMTLLSVPVSFTLFQLNDQDGPLFADPLALLEALRRYASRLTVFCQAGQIHVPKEGHLLLSQLETAVVEVTSPRGGVFHPKLAILRFLSQETDDRTDSPSVVYRLLCSSRNLTFDRSWDTLLAMEGALSTKRKNAYGRNQSLARFVRALPELMIRPAVPGSLDHIGAIADELLRVDFEVPDDFEDFDFFPIGIQGEDEWPVVGHRRTVTVAPFVNDGFIQRLVAAGGEHQLVSRIESLDALSLETVGKLAAIWYMNPAADPATAGEDEPSATCDQSVEAADRGGGAPPEQVEDVTASAKGNDALELAAAEQLSGLHAKLFVVDDGAKAHLWTGSANATTAAFENNVEFLVRLTGRRRECGVDSILPRVESGNSSSSDDRRTTFADLLLRYQRDAAKPVDHTQRMLEQAVDRVRHQLATSGLQAKVVTLGDDAAASDYRISLIRLGSADIDWPDNVVVSCHPATLRASAARTISSPVSEIVAEFEPVSFQVLTSFFAFWVTAREGTAEHSCGFVLNLPLLGAPSDREGRILLNLIRSRGQLLRYLLMLLADDEEAADRVAEILKNNDRCNQSGSDFGLPLLEPLLRALDRQPTQIDQIARLVDDVRRTNEGRELVSEEFLRIWQPIWEARRRMANE